MDLKAVTSQHEDFFNTLESSGLCQFLGYGKTPDGDDCLELGVTPDRKAELEKALRQGVPGVPFKLRLVFGEIRAQSGGNSTEEAQ